MRIVLASNSPRRKELLHQIFDEFDVIKSNFDEDEVKEKEPEKLVQILSLKKAEEVFDRIQNKENELLIIGGDTLVYFDKEILGKPKDKKEAFEMIKMLENNMHTVYTGLFILIKQGEKTERILTHSKTNVYFKELSNEQILEYIENEDILDKAGAYAIQGAAKRFVVRIDGNYNTVVGLDIEKLKEILEKYNIK